MEKTLRVVYSEDEIKKRVAEIAQEIRAITLQGDLTVVGILDDAFIFIADLIRALGTPLSCCFMKVARHRYGGQTEVMYTSEFDARGRKIGRASCRERV